jgi:hypothetical protein
MDTVLARAMDTVLARAMDTVLARAMDTVLARAMDTVLAREVTCMNKNELGRVKLVPTFQHTAAILPARKLPQYDDRRVPGHLVLQSPTPCTAEEIRRTCRFTCTVALLIIPSAYCYGCSPITTVIRSGSYATIVHGASLD